MGGNSDFSQALVLPTTGTYAIKLLVNAPLTGTATFTLYSVPPDATGSTTIGGSGVMLTTTVPGQGMQVSFPGTTNQTAKVTVSANASFASGCFTVQVLNPYGAVLSSGYTCGSTYVSAVLTLPLNGTYKVTVYSNGTATGSATTTVTSQ